MLWNEILLILVIAVSLIQTQSIPKYLQRKYGNTLNSPEKYQGLKTKTKTKSSYTKTGSGAGYKGTSKYNGGCMTEPQTPYNSGLSCSKFGGCIAKCIPNYQFANGQTIMYFVCDNGMWKEKFGYSSDTAPICQPICFPECKNNGICIAPNQCHCSENFSGPQCEFENKPCLNYPALPRNSRRMCRSKTCTITCLPGHEFSDGSAITTMDCKNGVWVPARQGWTSISDCQPKCDPPCQNGGNCLSMNVCQCPQDFRGPQCQYSKNACSAKKLEFNGAYNCTGNDETFTCSIYCPEGVQFEFAPESRYICRYDTGIFMPINIPQCVFENVVEMIPIGSAYNLYTPGYEDNLIFPQTRPDQFVKNKHVTKPDLLPSGKFHTENENLIQEKLPKPGVCFTWGGIHYKTFDGKIYSVKSKCSHVLVKDAVDNTFNVVITNAECKKVDETCSRIIKIFLADKEYVLKQSKKSVPIFSSGKKVLPIPGQLPGLRAEMVAHYILISIDSVGIQIKWDGKQMIEVDVNEAMWNRTEGLCGRFDGDPNNDLLAKDGTRPKSLVTLASSWEADTLGDSCKSSISDEHICQDRGILGSKPYRATEFCKKILSDLKFASCHPVRDIAVLMDACRWDFCACQSESPADCACDTVNVYVRACAHAGITDLGKWRDEDTCPMKCSGGRVYMACAPNGGQDVCGASIEKTKEQACEEGCYCPAGTFLHEDKCISKDQCPCRLRGKDFPSGTSIPKDCNTCTCQAGQWICTQISCGARCSAIGDPHYITFDGKRFDFMGQCSYYLMKADNFSIEAENVACSGAISEAMNFPSSIAGGLPSCTKTVTVNYGGHKLHLKQNHELTVNGVDINKIPHRIAGITVRTVSSIFIVVELPNDIEVWWDGASRAYIDVPSKFKGKTQGLCGTFNDNQKDDFLTPENDIETSVIPFANKWKTKEQCNDIPDTLKSHPCVVNIQNKEIAESFCKKLKSEIFEPCHWYVEPEQYYQDCLFDMCSCELKISKCLCPTLSGYAEECAAKGVKIPWRSEVAECGITCPAGQVYQECGNPCMRTCSDLAVRPDCKPRCVEGCNCPEGQTLDEHGECIPIGQCGCQHEGLDFPAGYKEVRPASKGQELCTCIKARWVCKPAKPDEIKQYPQAVDLKSKCDASKNLVFTTCESIEPKTCKNMHENDFVSAGVCHPGCECRKGYVLDTVSKTCVRPTDCPCHHGGRSFKENSVVQSDCNTCKCKNGKWDCTKRQCSAECSAWGDSHFRTFDGKDYTYQGQCDYVLAKGSVNTDDSFAVTIQNVPCGSLGTSCSKSVTINIGSGPQQESITLTRGKNVPLAQVFSKFTVRSTDLFVIVEASDIGLIVHWDKGTRVYVKVDPRWKDKVKGLCGNYNGNEMDDFQTPSGGIAEVSSKLFGDSWKLQTYCPETLEVVDTCVLKPDRKMWATKKCGVLKSATFAPCHSEVPVETYLEKCVFDACGCDQGGDCECLCTAIAAYAQECNRKGVPIKWRSQNLCPIQCDERCAQYSACVSPCPVETCENLLMHSPLTKLCKEDTCIEGCQPKPCPADYVYSNSSMIECIPNNLCKPICLEMDGIIYYEGDLMEEDDCHSCYCSRGKKSCKGHTCAEVVSTMSSVVTHQMEQYSKCKPGWTEWINQDKVQGDGLKTKNHLNSKLSDIEPLPSDILMNNLKGSSSYCTVEEMIDIDCRTVKTHTHYKETGLDVECSLERGLICESKLGQRPCPDFEIRVLCKCDEETCDPRMPNFEHPTNCQKFYQCDPNSKRVEKDCGPNMMYNPQVQICDWPQNVAILKPECAKPIEPTEETVGNEVDPSACPPGQRFDDCAVQCDKLCLHYEYIIRESGRCQNNMLCESGCVSEDKSLSCPPGMVWMNNHTCTAIQNCMCVSHDGKPVRAGTIFKESECMICQCIDNYYTCDTSSCNEDIYPGLGGGPKYTDAATNVVTRPTVISTLTPPKECLPDMYLDLIQGDEPLPDEAFTASSYQSDSYSPKNSRIDSKVTATSGGSWNPKENNQDQYLQIDLGRLEPVYGIVIKGSPLYTEYVTSFKVMYSPDGESFSYLLGRNGKPEVFRGSLDGNTPVQHIFNEPIEAKLVRVNPQSWHMAIALRMELIGCGKKKITTTPYPSLGVTPAKIEQCSDPMGIEEGMLGDGQITVSSQYGPFNSKKQLKLNEYKSWKPLTNSPTEWVQINFLEPRNITGFITKGGPGGWVTAFRVKYSHSGKEWNPLLDERHSEKIFLGNYDETTPYKNNFDMTISATMLKIMPIKWHRNIEMKLEVLGCYEAYPTMASPSTTQVSVCNHCPGTPNVELELGACQCPPHLWWDGEDCISRSQCPCIIGHIPYAVGTVYELEDCSQCICKLGGISHCNPKVCDKCENGLRSTVTSSCDCVCLPCEEGTILCPTSNICINATSWCDGILDCPDDEINCAFTDNVTIEPLVSTETISNVNTENCPKLECPEGYKVVKKTTKSLRFRAFLSTMFSTKAQKTKARTSYLPRKGGAKGGYKNALRRPDDYEKTQATQANVCPEYKCISKKPPPEYIPGKSCPPARCPPGFNPEFNDEDIKNKNICPQYECAPPSAPDAICNITGRTFNTFDKTEFKYDICNHILVRDLENLEYDISLEKKCSKHCTRRLVIHHDDHKFVFFPNMTVEYDDYMYTVTQTKKIGSQGLGSFSISRLGATLLFVSNHYGFWVIWDEQGNAKIGVSSKLTGKVDGLCGYYNNNPDDDKRTPYGSEARTTAEFGDSWAYPADKKDEECETKTCPVQIQNYAWDMCNQVKGQVLNACTNIIDVDAFISRCLETTCACIIAAEDNSTAEEICRCKTLESFVVDCMTADSNIELTDWRMLHDCPVDCDAPLVHHDCYRRRCEPTCDTISDPNICPKLDNVCFPGCYCPPGLVRKGDACIKSSTCKDCECNVLPHLQYVTYDDTNFTINGNCVFVMSRDVLEKYHDEHQFQVLITNAPCRDNPKKMCVGKVTILYLGHKVHIFYDAITNNLKLVADAERIRDFEEIADWAKVRQTKSKHFKISLFKLQIEVSVYFPSLGVSVKAPSHKYGGKLEGLCGDCNKDPDNDMRKPDGTITSDPDELGPSWLYDKLPGMSKETCSNMPQDTCEPLPIDEDPCVQLVDIERYAQCHPLLDPGMFIEWCRKDTCGGETENACAAISAYGRECQSSGFCVKWRSDLCAPPKCPNDQEYKACGTSCPKTCESIKNPEKASQCVEVPTDGCFCPEGKVLMNNTCVEERMCEVCDDEGHHSGDTWSKDACTTCSCVGTSIKCEVQHCPAAETVCEKGLIAVTLAKEETECCDKYICIPPATAGPTCETPQKLSCAPGQIQKLTTKDDGCQQFVCQCKAPEDCDPVDISADPNAEDGMVKELNDSGCCPVVEVVCKPELCSKAPVCDEFYKLKETKNKNKCCPTYTCEAPDRCIVDLGYIQAEKGGERQRFKYEKQRMLKGVNETWMDGPCRSCQCYGSNSTGYHSVCSVTECLAVTGSLDYQDYELLLQDVPGECCAEIKRDACKYKGEVYKVGQNWTADGDYCTKMECIETKNYGVQKLTQTIQCDTTCELGFAYKPALPQDKECCGSCKAIGCVVDGKIKKVGEEWHSSDFCTKYSCLNNNGSMQVQSVMVVCPEIPRDQLLEFVYEFYPIQGECCKKHKMIACKVNDDVYTVGGTWPSPDGNLCKKIKCIETLHGELVKQDIIETCNKDCQKGWEYVPSNKSCCGECVQTECLIGDELKKPGENWTSADGCTTFTCEKYLDQFSVNSQQESCPQLDDCPEENIYVKGCCKHCNITSEALTQCIPEDISGPKSVGIIKVERKPHGICENVEPLKGFTECIGTCHSSTSFNKKSGVHESICTCCRATEFAPLIVELTCKDGYKFKKPVSVPSRCSCEGCSANVKDPFKKVKSASQLSY